MLDISVDACLLRVHADLDGVVHGAGQSWSVCASQMVVSAHRLTGTRMFKRRAGEGRITAATLWCWSEPGIPPSSDAGSFHVLRLNDIVLNH